MLLFEIYCTSIVSEKGILLLLLFLTSFNLIFYYDCVNFTSFAAVTL